MRPNYNNENVKIKRLLLLSVTLGFVAFVLTWLKCKWNDCIVIAQILISICDIILILYGFSSLYFPISKMCISMKLYPFMFSCSLSFLFALAKPNPPSCGTPSLCYRLIILSYLLIFCISFVRHFATKNSGRTDNLVNSLTIKLPTNSILSICICTTKMKTVWNVFGSILLWPQKEGNTSIYIECSWDNKLKLLLSTAFALLTDICWKLWVPWEKKETQSFI